MNVRVLMLPLFLTGALLVGCDKSSSNSPEAADAAKAAANAKADVNKNAADAKAAADKAAANASANVDKAAADAKAAAAKTADDKTSSDAVRTQTSKMLADLQTAITEKKWGDAGPLVTQIDSMRDKLAADQKAMFDSLKKQFDASKP